MRAPEPYLTRLHKLPNPPASPVQFLVREADELLASLQDHSDVRVRVRRQLLEQHLERVLSMAEARSDVADALATAESNLDLSQANLREVVSMIATRAA